MSASEQNALGVSYWGVDYEQAAYWFSQAARRGHAKAQYNLGLCYQGGMGTPKDDKQAAYWFLLAANQGYPEAQYNLALCYQEGKGVQPNPQRALHWFQLAAEGGHTDAQAYLDQYNREKEAATSIHQRKASSPNHPASRPAKQQAPNITPQQQTSGVPKKELSGGEIVCIFGGIIIALSLIFFIIDNFGDIIDFLFSHPICFAPIVVGIGSLFKAISGGK